MSPADREAVLLKHFEDAIAGRRLNWTTAAEINAAIGTQYSDCDKLGERAKGMLQLKADELRLRGIVPPKTLLTACQIASLAERRRG